ncbi:hypothetical protein GOBAR_DD24910 [Gossypium barbadense]|nr:hypothetical protein GOBAR_DD24910 [Gossypium barbadense]
MSIRRCGGPKPKDLCHRVRLSYNLKPFTSHRKYSIESTVDSIEVQMNFSELYVSALDTVDEASLRATMKLNWLPGKMVLFRGRYEPRSASVLRSKQHICCRIAGDGFGAFHTPETVRPSKPPCLEGHGTQILYRLKDPGVCSITTFIAAVEAASEPQTSCRGTRYWYHHTLWD